MADFYLLLETKQPIWVTNHSGGKILLELRREGHKNKPFTVKLPPIKDYPFLLTNLVPYPILEFDSGTVFEWIRKGFIKVHDPKDVDNMYSKDPELKDAVEEMVEEANRERTFKTKDIGLATAEGALSRAEGFTGKRSLDDEFSGGESMEVDRNGTTVTLRLAAEQQRVNPKIAELMASLDEDGSQQNDVLVKLKIMDKDLMTREAYGFIIDNSTKFMAINKWARAQRAELVDETETRSRKRRK